MQLDKFKHFCHEIRLQKLHHANRDFLVIDSNGGGRHGKAANGRCLEGRRCVVVCDAVIVRDARRQGKNRAKRSRKWPVVRVAFAYYHYDIYSTGKGIIEVSFQVRERLDRG